MYAYDPVARDTFKHAILKELENNNYVLPFLHIIDEPFPNDPEIDAIMLLTEWKEFNGIDWAEVKKKYPKLRYVVDGRNALYSKRKEIWDLGINYIGVGVEPCVD